MGWGRLVLVLLGAGVASCTTWAWISLNRDDTGSMPLTRDLPHRPVEIGPAFDRRIEEQFPIGSAEAALDEALRRNGFVRDDRDDGVGGSHRATRTESNIACRLDYVVRWRADADGRLASVEGSVFIACL